MARSKFEIYMAILETLVLNGPMKPNKITCETNINYSLIKKAVNDLRNHKLIEERKMNNSYEYSATPKAKLALTQFKEISKNLPIFDQNAQFL